MFCSSVEEPGALRVFPHNVNVVTGANASRDTGPGFPVIVRAEDVGLAVVHLVAFCAQIRRSGLVSGGIDDADSRELRQAGRSDVRPTLAAVPRDVGEPVIRAGPNCVGLELGWSNRKYRGVDLGSVLVF